MFRSGIAVAVITALGGVVSIGNQLVLARTFGANSEMDVFLLSISLPLASTGLVVGVLGYILVPALQRRQLISGTADPLITSLYIGLGGCAIVVSLCCDYLSGDFLRILHPNISPQYAHLALHIARIAWIAMPLAIMSAVCTGALHLRNRYYCAAMMQSAPTLGALLLCLFGAPYFGVSALVWGQLSGYLISALVLTAILRIPMSIEYDWMGVLKLLLRAPYSLAALLIFIIFPVSDAFWGSRIGPSSVSYLGYAQRILIGIAGITVTGATTVIFPLFSKLAATNEHELLRQNLAASLRLMLICMVPSAVFLSLFSLPILQAIFQRGAFHLQDAESIALLLPWMLIGMVAMSCAALVFKALFAQNHNKAAAVASVCGTVIYFALSGLLSNFCGLRGIGMAYAISWWLTLVLSLASVWRGYIFKELKANCGFAVNLSLAAGLSGVLAWFVSHGLLSNHNSGNGLRLCVLASSCVLTSIVFLMLGIGPFPIKDVQTLSKRMASSIFPLALKLRWPQ